MAGHREETSARGMVQKRRGMKTDKKPGASTWRVRVDPIIYTGLQSLSICMHLRRSGRMYSLLSLPQKPAHMCMCEGRGFHNVLSHL